MPKARIEGTHIPINMAAFSSPLKYKISENISERNAETNNKISVIVNFLNMILMIFNFYVIQFARCKYECETNFRVYITGRLFQENRPVIIEA